MFLPSLLFPFYAPAQQCVILSQMSYVVDVAPTELDSIQNVYIPGDGFTHNSSIGDVTMIDVSQGWIWMNKHYFSPDINFTIFN